VDLRRGIAWRTIRHIGEHGGVTTDGLAVRMKAYENVSRAVLLPRAYAILRVDGRAFHTYLRDASKPYDLGFLADMQAVARDLCHEASGAVFAYGQSDEISVLLSDIEPRTQPWFGGVVPKIVSVAAGVATASLIARRGPDGRPHFDARVFSLPSLAEVVNYFVWRQRDAVRNSVSMAAQARFSPDELHGRSSGEMQEMLWARHGVNWNDYPPACRRGWVVTRIVREGEVTYTHKQTGTLHTTTALRSCWEARPAPRFVAGSDFFAAITSNGDAMSGVES
jgi:tRNA(His) 5'-end guanylyltransferase